MTSINVFSQIMIESTKRLNFFKIPEICVRMIWRVKGKEGGIKELVMEVSQAIWFDPMRDKPQLDEPGCTRVLPETPNKKAIGVLLNNFAVCNALLESQGFTRGLRREADWTSKRCPRHAPYRNQTAEEGPRPRREIQDSICLSDR